MSQLINCVARWWTVMHVWPHRHILQNGTRFSVHVLPLEMLEDDALLNTLAPKPYQLFAFLTFGDLTILVIV